MKNRILPSLFLTALAAGALFVAGGGVAAAADGFSSSQKTEIEAIVHDYLMKHPQVMIDALNAYQDQQREDSDKMFKEKIGGYKDFMTSSSSPYAGNLKGDVTIVEFFDYNCGYCKHAVDDVMKLIDQDKNVRVIFKDFPILSDSSGEAARYALAAQKQGKYFEFHQKLMKYPGAKNESAYKDIAGQLSLNFDKLKQDAESKEVRDTVEKNINVARELGINGTPAFIFGDRLVPGYISVDDMKQVVAQTRKGKG